MEQNKSINISLVDVVKLIYKDKKKMLIFIGIFACIGIIVAFTTPKKYKSSVMLAPEENSSSFSGNLSSLASMVGMDMKIGMSGDAIYPELYPDLLSSTDFTVNLFPVQIKTKDGSINCDYYTYLSKHQKLALTDYPLAGLASIKKLFSTKKDNEQQTNTKQKTPLWLTKEQSDIASLINSNINCTVDKKTSVISITVEDQDPLVAALMADSVRTHLQNAITEYRTHKAKVDEKFIEKIYNEAHSQYEKARQLYASYADANQELNLQSYKLKEEDLENEMQLKYNIYQQVVEQLQMAKAKVQEKTPAFTIVQSAIVPIKHSSRSKAATLFIWIFYGFIIRFIWLLWKNKSSFFNLGDTINEQ